jgi:hypothetical protein
MIFGRKRRERKVAALVASYDEGRRLMRQGDGADEWIGSHIARGALLALADLGRGVDGQPLDADGLVRLLRRHGLHTAADRLADDPSHPR